MPQIRKPSAYRTVILLMSTPPSLTANPLQRDRIPPSEEQMQTVRAIRVTSLIGALAVLAAVALAPSVVADPDYDAPPPPDPAGPFPISLAAGTPAVENQDPLPGPAPFDVAAVNPANGATVGVAKPIIIDFAAPVADRA